LAQHYLQRLEQEYPQSETARQLRSPHYAEDACRGEQIEDSLYTAAYEAFKHDDEKRVDQLFETAQKRFPKGNNHDKFLMISALNQLHQGRLSTALQRLNTLISDHPNSPLATMAGMIINGIQAGKTPHNGRFDLENVWQRRSEVLNDSDALHQVKFSNERQTPFLYVMVYAPDAVNENQLLFELAKYNFTNYLVRNFDIKIERREGVHQMTVGGFQNYDEALQYARAVHRQTAIQGLSKQARSVIISQENLALIGHPFSYRDYEKFYQQHFTPLKISTLQLLTEPVKTVTKQPEKPITAEDIDRELDRIIKEDGSFTLKVEPIKIESTAKNGLTIFELDGVTGSGSGVKYDSALMTYLGDIEANVNNIRVTHNGEQYPIGDINGKSSTQKTASGNYDASGEFTFKIDGATVKKIEPSIPVEPQSLRVKIKISELSAQSQLDLLQGFEALQQSLNIAAKTSDVGYMDKDKATAEATANLEKSQADYEKIVQEKFSAALQEAIKNKTRLNYELEGVTDSGKATSRADVGIRADSATPPEAWQKAIADVQNNPMALQELLKNNLDLHAEARINKSLTDKLGVSQFIESQGAMFITVEGEDYVAKLENDNGTLKLNGKPLPF